MTTNETMLQLTDGVDRSGKIAVDALPYVDDEVSLSRAFSQMGNHHYLNRKEKECYPIHLALLIHVLAFLYFGL